MTRLLTVCFLLCFCIHGGAQPDAKKKADQAWADFIKSAEAPAIPKTWEKREPTADEAKTFRHELATHAEKAADLGRNFRETFTDHRKKREALFREQRLLSLAKYFGSATAASRLEENKKALADTKPNEDERIVLASAVVMRLQSLFRNSTGLVAIGELEKETRALVAEFPRHEESFGYLLDLARDYYSQDNFTRASAIAQELLDADAPESADEEAKAMLSRIGRLGKPLTLEFTAMDGRKVDLAAMRGKVVLIDCWATWCTFCVEGMPEVKAAYEKFQPQGFEIIGIDFDEEKAVATKYLSKEKIKWPQYFDGKGWETKYGAEFQITSLPAMWLVDKKGVVRELNAHHNLEAKLRKLLRE